MGIPEYFRSWMVGYNQPTNQPNSPMPHRTQHPFPSELPDLGSSTRQLNASPMLHHSSEWWKQNPASSWNPPQTSGKVNCYFKGPRKSAISWPTMGFPRWGEWCQVFLPQTKRVWVWFILITEINQNIVFLLHFVFCFWETFGCAFANLPTKIYGAIKSEDLGDTFTVAVGEDVWLLRGWKMFGKEEAWK